MKKPSYIVFDVGGVLLNWRRSSEAVAKLLGVSREDLFDVMFDQSTDDNIGNQMFVGTLSSAEGWNKILEHYETDLTPQDIIESWHSREYWFSDTLELVRNLRDRDYKLAIMSNSWLGLADASKTDTFPEEIALFNKIFDSSVEKVKKPDERFFALVEGSLSVPPNELFLIDDTANNIQVADRRGWQSFLFDPSDEGRESIAALHSKLLV